QQGSCWKARCHSMSLPERDGGGGAPGATGHERLRLTPTAVRGEREALELLPFDRGFGPGVRSRLVARSRVLCFGVRAPAGAVRRDGGGLGSGAASGDEELPCPAEPVADAVGIATGTRERRQLRLRAQPVRTELDADQRRLARSC